ELLFAPGTRFSYSTLSFYVVAELVARRSGLPYPAYVRERICDPLGMSDTSFDPRAHQARTVPVGGITAGTDASPVEATAHYLSLAMPGAGLWSTAPDLVRFGQTLLAPTATGGLLTPATRDLMTRDHTADLLPFDNQGSFPVGYGLGWRRGIIDGRRTLPGSDRVFEHDGATGSELWIDPAADLIIVYLGSAFGADPAVWQTAVADVYSTIRSVCPGSQAEDAQTVGAAGGSCRVVTASPQPAGGLLTSSNAAAEFQHAAVDLRRSRLHRIGSQITKTAVQRLGKDATKANSIRRPEPPRCPNRTCLIGPLPDWQNKSGFNLEQAGIDPQVNPGPVLW
ncbi:MAG: beta-lactamase family protein, partial [Cryobacterium sp.]|nr:beta-lactamase family protein [Cryobacterium sp.]